MILPRKRTTYATYSSPGTPFETAEPRKFFTGFPTVSSALKQILNLVRKIQFWKTKTGKSCYRMSWQRYNRQRWSRCEECIPLLYAFSWVIPRCLNLICQHFGTLCLFHLYRRLWRWNRQRSETSEYKNSDAAELPRRKRTTFRTRRKSEIKNVCF